MLEIELQNTSEAGEVPPPELFRRWAVAALLRRPRAEVVIRIVDREESAELNQRYRHQSGPTNVLSFPFRVPQGVPNELLGDLVICAPVVRQEAETQGKRVEAHWAHMTVHGLLHLQGFNHIEEDDAAIMEAEEIVILEKLGFPSPYEEATAA